jgi:perosamine synthetase
MPKIRQVDLDLDTRELQSIQTAIEARWLTEGAFTARLTEAIQAATRSRHVTFAPNGTLGLFLALLALDLPRGGEILIPSFTFYGSATAAVFAGLVPRFVDCHPDTYNIDVADAARHVTSRTVAIMPVHIYGQTCDLDGIIELARAHGLKIVEDAAQAFGATFTGRAAGTFGDIGVISFFSDKIVTMGEGAALLTQDARLFERLRLMRNQGRPHAGTFVHPELGMNFRITDVQAAIGSVQLAKFDDILARRLRLCDLYAKRLAGVGDLRPMTIDQRSNFVPFRYPVTSTRRERIEQALNAAEVDTRGFFYPMHLQPKLREFATGPLPVSEMLHETGLCLPVHAHITESDVARICDTITSCF